MSGLFNSKLIKKTVKNAQSRGSYDSAKPVIEGGKQLLTFSKVESKNSKADGEPMIIIHFSKDEYRDMNAAFKIAGRGGDIGKERYIEFLWKGFNYTLQDCDSVEEAVDQAKQFVGETIQVAVRHKESLYAFTDREGNDKMKVVSQPEYWYAGHRDDDKFTVNVSKLTRELKPEEKERLLNFEELQGTVVNQKVNEEPEKVEDPIDASSDEDDDDLPF